MQFTIVFIFYPSLVTFMQLFFIFHVFGINQDIDNVCQRFLIPENKMFGSTWSSEK